MKQLFCCYLKGTTTLTISLFMLLFVATKTNAQWIELDGTNGSPFNSVIESIATDADRNVYTAGAFTDTNGDYYVAKWNGTAWSELADANGSPFNYYILSIATDASGNVYAGGSFTNANGKYYVAKWNGTAWIELADANGSPFKYDINSIATDADGNVYAGGDSYDFYNGKTHYYVAKWNGTAWSKLGGTTDSPLNSNIRIVATDTDGNVYAGGMFIDAKAHHYVAKWNGTAWSELGDANGSPFNNGYIESVATDAGGNVYAGGTFDDSNGFGNAYVAKWNGTAWSKLADANGSPFKDFINSVTTDAEGNVYAVGDFTNANGNYYVVKWNGTTWSELGGTNSSQFKDFINSVATDTSGNVYAGGFFTDSHAKIYVAKYAQTVLPVTLVSITATKEKGIVAINWQTALETNSSHFNVQRRIDGNSFIDIGNVKAVGSGANSYRFIDNNPANGSNYYRLQNVDRDGSFTYSPIRVINEAISFSASIYPNPVQNKLTLSFNSDKAKIVQVQIVSNEGKLITMQQIQVAAGASTQNINTASLSNGEYHIKLVSKEEQTVLKFVKER